MLIVYYHISQILSIAFLEFCEKISFYRNIPAIFSTTIDIFTIIIYNIVHWGDEMLISFGVSNFLSFDSKQYLSMEAGKGREHSERLFSVKNARLLKFAAIYGANASGKSNLISAIGFAQNVILNGLRPIAAESYCKIHSSNKEAPSSFEFAIEVGGKRFVYGFEAVLSELRFTKEWLHELTYAENYKVIFERNVVTSEYMVTTYFKNNSLIERLNIYMEDIKFDANVLFLKQMNQSKSAVYEMFEEAQVFKAVFGWFAYRLSVNSPNSPVTDYFHWGSGTIEEISRRLSEFGTGISHIDLVDVPIEKLTNSIPKEILQDVLDNLNEQRERIYALGLDSVPTIMVRNNEDNSIYILELKKDNTLNAVTIQLRHKNTNAIFSLGEESDGTVRLLDLIEILITNDEHVYVIDEINRCLHPNLTCRFVEEYLKLASERKSQLIVTTHELMLMNFNLLRKDEIGLVEKDDDGITTMTSLKYSNVRYDKKIINDYIHGKFGKVLEVTDIDEG